MQRRKAYVFRRFQQRSQLVQRQRERRILRDALEQVVVRALFLDAQRRLLRVLADALMRLFTDDKLYDDMSRDCKKIYNEKFTADVNSRRIEAVYKSLADRYGKDGGKNGK